MTIDLHRRDVGYFPFLEMDVFAADLDRARAGNAHFELVRVPADRHRLLAGLEHVDRDIGPGREPQPRRHRCGMDDRRRASAIRRRWQIGEALDLALDRGPRDDYRRPDVRSLRRLAALIEEDRGYFGHRLRLKIGRAHD